MKEGLVQPIELLAQMPTEFQFLEDLVEYRVRKYFPGTGMRRTPVFPTIDSWHPPIRDFIVKHGLNDEECIMLIIALAPHLQPDLFDRAIDRSMRNADGTETANGENFPKIGGIRGVNSRTFLPTGETALFLICGDHWEKRMEVQKLFWANHFFAIKKILWLEE